jgi:hypothetical protein
MAIVVPSTDPVNFALQADIATLSTLITSNATNYPLVFKLTKDKANKQLQLVLGLLGQGSILAANVISSGTYAAAQPGGDQI